MKDYCKYADVFLGCDEIDLPEAVGVAAAWRFIKGLCGNNTPAAALPFGRLTACCYSGGYSAGYGRLRGNSHGAIGKISERNQFKGIAHLQNDGTGAIDTYYNFAVISPFSGELSGSAAPRDFSDERACPGYYACRDSMTGADCETTVTPRAALHRITFPEAGGRVSIDFSNDGLYDGGGKLRSPAGAAEMTLLSGSEAAVRAVLHGLPIYFHIKVSGARGMRLWADDIERGDARLSLAPGHRFGVVIEAAQTLEITLGLSPKSAEIARRDATTNDCPFDAARVRARAAWNRALGRIEAEFDDPRDMDIFYSNFYHSLIKPCDYSGESFLYGEHAFALDFATIWDQYKTQFPLVFTLFPDMAKTIAETILNVFAATKKMPHTLMMNGDAEEACPTQARMLAEHALADAYLRGVPFDVKKALEYSLTDMENGRFDEYAENAQTAEHKAFVLDITDACAACALMARETGEKEIAERFERVAAYWERVFDPATGLLRDGEKFYEGTKWNYSFRLLHDMPARMALAGGKEAFAALADRFFGFAHPEDESACCFEGFNNETDMESPYVYHFAGRHDRLCEVIAAGLTSMFATGRGGVPGNNDSGGLCSCYLWNALGVFPVSGQDLMIVGSPRVRRARLALASGKELTIRKNGSGIQVKRATLNGQPLPDLSLTVRDMMAGGELIIDMEN